MSGDVTIGALKRLSNYLAGQLKSSVSITGGTISGVTVSGATLSTANIAVNVEDGSTVTSLANNGLSTFGSESTAAATYTLAAPDRAGIVKWLRSDQTDTLIKTVNITGTLNDSSTLTKLLFDTNSEAVGLISESTAVWSVIANNGSVSLSS